MSCMKRAFEDAVEVLAKRSGYDYFFLMEKYADFDGSWDDFTAVAISRGW